MPFVLPVIRTAAELIFTPVGSIEATDVQAAIAELDGDISGLAADKVPYSGASGAVDLGVENLTTTGLGTFGNLVVDTLNLNGNVISDSTGTISLGDDNIWLASDTGLFKAGAVATDYTFGWDGSNAVHTVTAGDFVFTGGNVGIGTASPSHNLTIGDLADANNSISIRSVGDSKIFALELANYGGIFGYNGVTNRIVMNKWINSAEYPGIVMDRSIESYATLKMYGQLFIYRADEILIASYETSNGHPFYSMKANDGSTTKVQIHSNGDTFFKGGDVKIQVDSAKLYLGAGDDSYLEYQNTVGLYCKPNQVTAANVFKLDGKMLVMDKIAFTQTDKNEYIDSLADGYMDYGATTAHRTLVGGTENARVDGSVVAGETRLMVWDVDNSALERVTVGVADSGGAGFKVLKIPN